MITWAWFPALSILKVAVIPLLSNILNLNIISHNFLSEVMKFLVDWQRRNHCLIELIYVPTKVFFISLAYFNSYYFKFYFKENLADAPSREVPHDELSVSNAFLRLVEKDLGVFYSFDTCRSKSIFQYYLYN